MIIGYHYITIITIITILLYYTLLFLDITTNNFNLGNIGRLRLPLVIHLHWYLCGEVILVSGLAVPFFEWDYIYISTEIQNWLVVSAPLKNMLVRWDDYSQSMDFFHSCSKPPTRKYTDIYIYLDI